MENQIVEIYCLTDDILRALNHREDPRCRMSDAEVITTAVTATRFFGGNSEMPAHGSVLRLIYLIC